MELSYAKKEIGEIIHHLNARTACFTGHRSQKLPWRYNEEDTRCQQMKSILRTEVEKAIHRGYKTFLFGMAIGFGLICAETILDLKKQYEDIELISAIPCKNQDMKWSEKDKKRYRNILEQLAGIRCIYDEHIGAECMLERNRFMVNNSSLIIALFNGLSGGTKATLDYARKQGLDVIIIECQS